MKSVIHFNSFQDLDFYLREGVMPKAIENKMKKEAQKKGLKGDRKNACANGMMNKIEKKKK